MFLEDPIIFPEPPFVIPLHFITLGVLDDLELPQITIPSLQIGPLDLLPFIAEEDLEAFVITEPSMTLRLIDRERDGQPNEAVTTVAELNNFIVEPSKIPGAAADEDPATIRVRITSASGTTEIVAATLAAGNTIHLRSDLFSVGTNVSYEVIPDKINLLKLNLIGLACEDDVAAAAGGVQTVFRGATASGNGVLDPLIVKMGRNFPGIPIDDYNACLARQTADPTISQAQCISDVSNGYLSEILNFTLDLVCIGANRVISDFEVNRQFASADGKDAVTVSMTIRDSNGVNLLEDFLPNANIPEDYGVQFITTIGTVGPVIFDTEASRFRANIISDKIGSGQITAAFLVRGETCIVPGESDGFSITDKVIDVEFRRPGGAFPRRRRSQPPIQAAGGRRR